MVAGAKKLILITSSTEHQVRETENWKLSEAVNSQSSSPVT